MARNPVHMLKSGLKMMALGAVGFCGLNIAAGNAKFHEKYAMPIIHSLVDPEMAHRLGILQAKYKFLPLWGANYAEHAELKVKIWDHEFPNCVGLAAGFDKDGEAVDGLDTSGFGFIEIGSVTPEPQPGNPKPRVFRLAQDAAVINRYGFNSEGYKAVAERLKENSNRKAILGVNLGKNKEVLDPLPGYENGLELFSSKSDYIVLNVSSPNTPGLRNYQRKSELERILRQLKRFRNSSSGGKNVILLLKISPDLSQTERGDIAEIALSYSDFGVDGLIISNTTVARPVFLQSELKFEEGGLSGAPLKQLSTDCIRDFYRMTDGRVPIVGCGGISSGADAYEKIKAGASLVQIYTALIYQGFPVIGRIKQELAECLRKDGFTNVAQAVGRDIKIAEAAGFLDEIEEPQIHIPTLHAPFVFYKLFEQVFNR